MRISTYERRHQQAVTDLFFHGHLFHAHLDWHAPDHWLAENPAPARLGWQEDTLSGLLAASQPLNHTCWLRIAALRDTPEPQDLLRTLWDDLVAELRALGVLRVAALIIQDWLMPYVDNLGFRYHEDIVTLVRSQQNLPPNSITDVPIRSAAESDLSTMLQIDNAAFAPPWQLAPKELRQAWRIAATCTVAEIDNEIVGYQLSTRHRNSLHLARLAVSPNVQRGGVGSALLHDLLERFGPRQTEGISVNTQASNLRSQRLYQRFGFRPNGYDLPVWVIDL